MNAMFYIRNKDNIKFQNENIRIFEKKYFIKLKYSMS